MASGGNAVRAFPCRAWKIRDDMDDLFDRAGLYRKHVAREQGSLYRAVADALYGTQYYWGLVRKARDLFCQSREGKAFLCGLREATAARGRSALGSSVHEDVRILARVLGVSFEVFTFEFDTIYIGGGPMEGPDGGSPSASDTRVVVLCYVPDHQYDPVYPKERIWDRASMVQSLLYELLYTRVFRMTDAPEAAAKMLQPEYDPIKGKPEVYDRGFEGTAMEALEQHLIPFPYKVAKALDPYSYRNIEYDAWICERKTAAGRRNRAGFGRARTTSDDWSNPSVKALRSLSQGFQPMRHIRNRKEGCEMPKCLVLSGHLSGEPGLVVDEDAAFSKRAVKVFLPRIHRLEILPRKSLAFMTDLGSKSQPQHQGQQGIQGSSDQGFLSLGKPSGRSYSFIDGVGCPREATVEYNCLDVVEVQSRNVSLALSNQSEWLAISDFTVPPPALATFSGASLHEGSRTESCPQLHPSSLPVSPTWQGHQPDTAMVPATIPWNHGGPADSYDSSSPWEPPGSAVIAEETQFWVAASNPSPPLNEDSISNQAPLFNNEPYLPAQQGLQQHQALVPYYVVNPVYVSLNQGYALLASPMPTPIPFFGSPPGPVATEGGGDASGYIFQFPSVQQHPSLYQSQTMPPPQCVCK